MPTKPITWHAVLLLAALGTVAQSAPAHAQVVVTGGGFVPGGQVLFATNFSQDRVGNFPSGLTTVDEHPEADVANGLTGTVTVSWKLTKDKK
jgi:hypothetical protein